MDNQGVQQVSKLKKFATDHTLLLILIILSIISGISTLVLYFWGKSNDVKKTKK